MPRIVPESHAELTKLLDSIEQKAFRKKITERQKAHSYWRLEQLRTRIDEDEFNPKHKAVLRTIREAVEIDKTRGLNMRDHQKILALYRYYVYRRPYKKR